jgi:amidase
LSLPSNKGNDVNIVVMPLDLGGGDGGGLSAMVKDTIDVADCPTCAGSRALAGTPAATDHAAVVKNLLAAGCRLLGKTNLHELAYGTTGINRYTGTPVNPRFPDRIPGGSSSGSAAAVAAGLCDFALGTDTGGSIRTPACCCGVFGLKPTFGRVSREGVMPAVSSLDCVGPLARNLPTLVRAMQAIDPGFGLLPELSGFEIGVVSVEAEPDIRTTIEHALQISGLPFFKTSLPGMATAYDAGMKIIGRETWNACGHLVATGRVGEDVAARLTAVSRISDAEINAAEAVRAAFTAEVDAALHRFPILALPNMPFVPPLLQNAADTEALLGMTRFARPFNLSGHPALSIPFTGADGLPVGLQLVAAKGADEFLLAAASELLRRLPVHHPSLNPITESCL